MIVASLFFRIYNKTLEIREEALYVLYVLGYSCVKHITSLAYTENGVCRIVSRTTCYSTKHVIIHFIHACTKHVGHAILHPQGAVKPE